MFTLQVTTIIIFIQRIIVLSIYAALPDCQQQFFQSNHSNWLQPDNNSSLYSLLEDTKQCDEILQQKLLFNNENNLLVEACADELLEVDLIPRSVFPVGTNILPYVQLNITLSGRAELVDELIFQFRCLYAHNSHDYLCHNHNIQQQKWGRMIWPCRKLEFGQTEKKEFAYQFSYSCFHLFGQSQYAVEFLLVQQSQKICRKTFYLTIPLERQLDPKIDQFYIGNAKNSNELFNQHLAQKWSPLIALENSSDEAIQILLNPAEWIQSNRHINITIYSKDERNDAKMQLALSERIFPKQLINKNGKKQQHYRWKWTDIDASEYTVYAFLDDANCQLKNCATEIVDGCKLCPFTMLNFTISQPKHSMEWRRTLALMRFGKYTAIVVFAALVGILSFLLATFYYVRHWKPRVIARQHPRSIELINRPNVLVIYTDDCQAHSNAVMALCQTLEEAANARCIVDQIEFVENPALRPSIWLVEKLAECDFVLVIFSACSPKVLQGERMAQRRHFPNYFNMAIGFISTKINEITSREGVLKCTSNHLIGQNSTSSGINQAEMSSTNNSGLNRFIFARLTYSPPTSIPTFFASTQFGGGGPLCLPQQIGPLIAKLHGILDGNGRNVVENGFEHQADLSKLNKAIEEFQKFADENPNWMAGRFVQQEKKEANEAKNRPTTMSSSNSTMRNKQDRGIPTLTEQAHLAEQFGLLEPDEDEKDENMDGNEVNSNGRNEKKQRKYALIGRVEDYGDSSNSSSIND